MARRPVDPQQSFPALEQQVLERWRERDVFRESLRRRQGAEPWVFYEGPPTANGRPGSHHVLARVFKDIYPRFKTMRGFYVERKGGWDCHGLPVEIAVEQQLGITTKAEIEAYGIAEFNARCRESVFEFLEDWNALTERIGFWIDLEDAYRTLDPSYIESVWWALRTISDKGLLYEGHKVVPYCPRCGTALSSHELALGYEDVVDPSIYVRLPVTEDGGPLQAGDELLVWTTTPWTLVSNAAVAVDPELTYVRAKAGPLERPVVLAEALVERVLGKGNGDGGVQILARFPGAALDGVRYQAPFPYLPAQAYGERGHTVLLGDFVTADDGTGLVHTAIAFGEDDFRLGEQYGLNVINPVRPDGTYDERIGPYAGRFVKDADRDLIADLRRRGRLLREEEYEHAYPHCWRCGTPLLYYAKPSWYIATTKHRDDLLAANDAVDWHPEHIKNGRMGEWLRGNVDWALSRERYWGTPLPVWRCERRPCPRDRLVRRARGPERRPPRGPAPAVRRRRPLPVPRVQPRDDPRAGGHRRLVRLRVDAVRPVARAARARGRLPRPLPRRLHLRGARPDARVVLLAARGQHAALRPRAVRARRLPRPHPRRRRPEDEQVPRQHRRAVGRHRPLRRRRVPLVLLHVQAAVGRLPLQHRRDRRQRPPLPAAAVELLQLPHAVRARARRRSRPTSTAGSARA